MGELNCSQQSLIAKYYGPQTSTNRPYPWPSFKNLQEYRGRECGATGAFELAADIISPSSAVRNSHTMFVRSNSKTSKLKHWWWKVLNDDRTLHHSCREQPHRKTGTLNTKAMLQAKHGRRPSVHGAIWIADIRSLQCTCPQQLWRRRTEGHAGRFTRKRQS